MVAASKSADVLSAGVAVNDQWRVSMTQEDEQGQGSGHPPVAVFEGVDGDEGVMQPCCQDERVNVGGPTVQLNEPADLCFDMLWGAESHDHAVFANHSVLLRFPLTMVQ